MEKYEEYIKQTLSNIESLIVNTDTILIFLSKDLEIRKKVKEENDFFSFEHVRSKFNLDNYCWICLLISVFNEIDASKKVDPIETVMKIVKFKSMFEKYKCRENLESKCFNLFLDKNKRIDKNIFSFLMTNGISSGNNREFSIYFPSDNEIVRESEAQSLAKICSSLNDEIYCFISSKAGMGKKFLIKRVASICSKALIIVDIDKCLNSEKEFTQIIVSALRQAMLLDGIICFDKFDIIQTRKRKLEFIFKVSKFFCQKSFFLINNEFDIYQLDTNAKIIEYKLKKLKSSQISQILKETMSKYHIDDSLDYQEISSTFLLTPKQIEIASKIIFSNKILKSDFNKNLIFKAIQKTAQANFEGKASLIENNCTWDDLIISESDKKTIIDICKQRKLRNVVFENWKLEDRINYGKGLSLLFSGPPGTGKTMIAGIIANEIGLKLYKADLSKIVSKYIGETEKNLSSLFDEAERSNSILLFDETDALFSQRTDVKDSKDRGANLEISHLLQKIENHNGVCIMTTNYIENIDKAFFRRISYVFHFSNPNKSQRKAIWKNIFGKNVPLSDDIDFDFISKFEISGGSIKNIVVSSCLKAAQDKKKVTMQHIVRSIEYELKKQGYTPLKSDFEQYEYLI